MSVQRGHNPAGGFLLRKVSLDSAIQAHKDEIQNQRVKTAERAKGRKHSLANSLASLSSKHRSSGNLSSPVGDISEGEDDATSDSTSMSYSVTDTSYSVSDPITTEQSDFVKRLLRDMDMVDALLLCLSLFSDEWETFCAACIPVFLGHRQGFDIAQLCVQKEVSGTRQHLQLFREDSLYLSILRRYIEVIGQSYIKKGTKPLGRKLLSPEQAKLLLLRKLQAASPPSDLCDIIQRMSVAIKRRFPKLKFPETFAVTFFFLRVLSPVITNPDGDATNGNGRGVNAQYLAMVCRSVQLAVNSWAQCVREQARPENGKVHDLIQSICAQLLGATVPSSAPVHSVSTSHIHLAEFVAQIDRFKAPIKDIMRSGSDPMEVLRDHFGARARYVVSTQLVTVGKKKKSSTVRFADIPKKFEPTFVKAADLLTTHYEDISRAGSQGTVYVFGERHFLLAADSFTNGLSSAWSDIDTSVMQYNMMRAMGAQDCKAFSAEASMGEPMSAHQLAAACLINCAGLGWARFKLIEGAETGFFADGSLTMVFQTHNSFCRGDHSSSDPPVCHAIRGYVSGWIAVALNDEMVHCAVGSTMFLTSSKRRLAAKFKSKNGAYTGIGGVQVSDQMFPLAGAAKESLTPQTSVKKGLRNTAKLKSTSDGAFMAGEISPRDMRKSRQTFSFFAEPLNGTILVQQKRFVLVNARFMGECWNESFPSIVTGLAVQNQSSAPVAPAVEDDFLVSAGLKQTLGRSMGLYGLSLLGEEYVLASQMAALPNFFSSIGLGTLYMEPLSFLEPEFSITFRVKHSFEVTSGSEIPSCFFIAGLLNGWCSGVTDTPLHTLEVQCRCMSGGKCVFVCTAARRVLVAASMYLTAAGMPFLFNSLVNGLLKKQCTRVPAKLPTEIDARPQARKSSKASRFMQTLKRGAQPDLIQAALHKSDDQLASLGYNNVSKSDSNNASDEAAQNSEIHSQFGAGPRSYLVADDVESNLVFAESILQMLDPGCNVVTVDNGVDAVKEATSERQYDLVLMDIKMPGMDGITATIKIRLKNPFVPIIALTGFDDLATLAACKEGGMNGTMNKPFKKLLMSKTLLQHLVAPVDKTSKKKKKVQLEQLQEDSGSEGGSEGVDSEEDLMSQL